MEKLRQLFESTKFRVALIAVIAVLLVQFVNLPEAKADTISEAIVMLASLFILGHAATDVAHNLANGKRSGRSP